MKPILITPPAALPVSVDEAKAAARIDFGDDDLQIEAYLAAAVAHLDGYSGVLGRCLVTQTWRQGFASWAGRLRLPFPDVSSATVKYVDDAGIEQTVDPGLYELVAAEQRGEIAFKEGFTAPDLDLDQEAPVFVEFTAGYGDATEVPADIKIAIKALTRHWYDGGSGEPAPMRLIDKYRTRPV